MPQVLDFVCPTCYSTLERQDDGILRCVLCARKYHRRGPVDIFLSDDEWKQVQGWETTGKGMHLPSYHNARRNVSLTVMYYDYWMERLIRLLPVKQNQTLLELMCGEGEISRRFNSSFTRIFAVDLDIRMVENLSADLSLLRVVNVVVACADAARLPLPNECIDYVAIVGGFHHVRPIMTQVVREISRVLKPGGIIVGSEPANDNLAVCGLRHFQYRHSRRQGRDEGEDGFTRGELKEMFDRSNLVLDRYDRFGFIAYPLMGNTDILPLLARFRSARLASALLRLDEFLEKTPGLRRLAFASLFRAVKEKVS